VRAARFAYGLARALRARGANVAALLVSQPHRSGGESARQLEGLGARPVAVLSEAELPQAALQVLHELPQTVVVIAVGPSLAESLQGLLTVLVGPEPRAIGHEPGPADAIDLQLELELEGVATRIADWLASEVASR
jgi:hypothetical protein